MGILRNFIENLKEQAKERDEMDDDQTKDRFLRSLRRQRRIQLEGVEKHELKKKIKEHELNVRRGLVFGEATREKSIMIKEKILQKKKLMQQKQVFIPKKRPQKSFLSKGNL